METATKYPLTQEMQSYIKADIAEKAAKKIKDKYKDVVKNQLRINPESYDGIKYYTREKVSWIDDNFYAWVKNEFPGHLEQVSKSTIDYEKFEGLVAADIIKYNTIPENVYNRRVEEVVQVSAKK